MPDPDTIELSRRLNYISALAQRGLPHSSKDGQDFLEWIRDIAEGEADPEAIYEAARTDYEDTEGSPWELTG